MLINNILLFGTSICPPESRSFTLSEERTGGAVSRNRSLLWTKPPHPYRFYLAQ